MPYSGGNYSAPSSPGAFNPAISSQQATAIAWNALLADIATALSTAVLKDGTQTITQNIPFNGKRITGVGNATHGADAVNAAQILDNSLNSGNDSGTANAYVINPPIGLASYVGYQTFQFFAQNSNTTSSTLSISGLPPQAIVHADGTPLLAGDILAGQFVSVIYTGSDFELWSATGLRGTANTWRAPQTFTSAITYGGVTLANAVTGTGKMVLEASPVLSGADLGTTSFAHTQSPGTNNTSVATTAYVDATIYTPPQTAQAYVTIAAGVATIEKQTGFTSVVRTAAGEYECTLSTPMPDLNYVVDFTCGSDGSGGAINFEYQAVPRTTTVFHLATSNNIGFADSNSLNIKVYA